MKKLFGVLTVLVAMMVSATSMFAASKEKDQAYSAYVGIGTNVYNGAVFEENCDINKYIPIYLENFTPLKNTQQDYKYLKSLHWELDDGFVEKHSGIKDLLDEYRYLIYSFVKEDVVHVVFYTKIGENYFWKGMKVSNYN